MQESIIQLIKTGEGLRIEFKRKIDSVYKIAKTITSFANTSGGMLLIGVGDNGEILGVVSELRELQKLEKAITSLIETELMLSFSSELIDGKRILKVAIEESADKPIYAINEKNERVIYIRVKDKSIPIPRLLMSGARDADIDKVLASRHVKTLINYLKETDSVTAKDFSKVINISEKRAARFLNDLYNKQILMKIPRTKPEAFSLKWAE